MTQLNFDANQVEPSTGQLDPIPMGWHNMMLVGSDVHDTRNQDGKYLKLELQVIDGKFAGRKVYTNLNLWNGNPTAVEIAYKDLSALAHAVGVLTFQDTTQLHGIPLKVKVKVRAADPAKGYDAQNDVAAYKPATEDVPLVGHDAGPAMPGMPGGQAMPGAAPPAPPAMPAAPAAAPMAAQPWQQPAAAPAAAPAPTQPPPATPAPPAAPAAPAAAPQPDWANQAPTQPAQAPAAAPAAPATPDPAAAEAAAAQGAAPPWQQGAAAPAAPEAPAAGGAPPWQQPAQ